MYINKKILIVGIGNTIRCDDGLGAFICSSIEKLALDGVTTMITQQLHTELLNDFLAYDHIVLVDAAVTEDTVLFQRLKKKTTAPVSTSHAADANLLASLAQQLYQKELSIMICAVKGYNFEIGERLSASAKKNADAAISIICNWIKNDGR